MVIEAHGFKLVAGNEGIQAMFVPTDDPPGNYVARRENYEAIREKFATLEEKKRKASYRYKEKLKAWIRELLKSVGLFEMVLALREKISGPKIQWSPFGFNAIKGSGAGLLVPKWISELMMKVFEHYGLKDKINILYSKLGEDPIF